MQHLGICVGCCCELPTQRSAVQIVIAALAKLWYQCKAKRRAAPSLLYLSNTVVSVQTDVIDEPLLVLLLRCGLVEISASRTLSSQTHGTKYALLLFGSGSSPPNRELIPFLLIFSLMPRMNNFFSITVNDVLFISEW